MKEPPNELRVRMFHRGTDLDDAKGERQGVGKAMRHIKLEEP